MSGTGYDLSTSIYSQDGRIFQIEYAQKSIDNSETVVGFVCSDGVILACESILTSQLQVRDQNQRIFSIDNHIGIAVSGRITDGQIVIERAKKEAEGYRQNFGIPITGSILTERIANYIHAHTLYGQFRPLGIEIFIASWDNKKPYLFKIENTGAFKGYYGCASGKGNLIARTELERIKQGSSCQESLQGITMAIVKAHEEFKEKTYEFQLSQISKDTNFQHKFMDWEVRENLKKKAEEEIE